LGDQEAMIAQEAHAHWGHGRLIIATGKGDDGLPEGVLGLVKLAGPGVDPTDLKPCTALLGRICGFEGLVQCPVNGIEGTIGLVCL
jgi:hypothetical protein